MGSLRGGSRGRWRGHGSVLVKGTSVGGMTRTPPEASQALICGAVGANVAKTMTRETCFIVMRMGRD